MNKNNHTLLDNNNGNVRLSFSKNSISAERFRDINVNREMP